MKIRKKTFLKKSVNIAEKIVNFNKQQKGKQHPSDLATHIKILTRRQMVQRLSITQARVKGSNKSEILQNEIHQIIDSSY